MFPGHRAFLVGVFSLQVLCACSGWNPTSEGSESGTLAPPGSSGSTTSTVAPPKAGNGGNGLNGSDDAVAATTTVGGTVSVTAGASQTVNVSFTTSDGLPISGFAVSGTLGVLPAGWSGPGSFTCAAVGPGSGCTLSLTYAPSAVDSGTLTLDCVYIDNAGLPRTPGPCATLTYAATVPNNVAAYLAPAGEIDAMVGAAKQTVLVDFTTDDGTAATGLTVTTNLAALPSGWSSAKPSFTCAIVSTGSGCQLPLIFAPTAAAAGALSLTYSYLDNSGATRSGTLNIPYAAIAHDSVIAAVSPSGRGHGRGAIRFAVGGGHLRDRRWQRRVGAELEFLVDCLAARLEQCRENLCLQQRQHRQWLPAAADLRADRARQRRLDFELCLHRFQRNAQCRAREHPVRRDYQRQRRGHGITHRPDQRDAGSAWSAGVRDIHHRRWPAGHRVAAHEQPRGPAGRLEQRREFHSRAAV